MAGQLRSPTRQRSPRHARIAGQPHRADCRADRPSTWWRHAGSRRRRSRPSDSGRSGGCSRGARTGQCRYAGLPATATSAGLRQDEILGCSAGSGGNAGIIWSRAGERPPGIRRLRIFRLTRFRSPRGHCSGAAVEHRLPRGFRPVEAWPCGLASCRSRWNTTRMHGAFSGWLLIGWRGGGCGRAESPGC